MIGIVVSEADPASRRIGDALLELAEWEVASEDDRPAAEGGGTVHRSRHFELRTFDELHLELEAVAEAFDRPSVVVFVSRHAGDTGRLLSVHFPGNVGSAAYGGLPHELPPAAPETLRELFDGLREVCPSRYDVGIECTHHGPSRVGVPCLFAELGSGPPEWEDDEAARAVAQGVLSLSPADPTGDRTFVGFGGSHYAPRFGRILRETEWRVGHIAADWGLAEVADEHVRRELVSDVFEQSAATIGLIDGELPAIREAIVELGYRVVSETWLREADGVSLEVVDAAEASLGPIDAGTRLGAQRDVDVGNLQHTALPRALVDEIQGIDRAEAVSAVSENAVAYTTTENGNRLAGELLLPAATGREAVLAACVDLLTQRYPTVEWEDEAIVIEEHVFDPGAARSLGVPEGPAFGELAAGRSVEVDDRVVEPAEVFRLEERRISLRAN